MATKNGKAAKGKPTPEKRLADAERHKQEVAKMVEGRDLAAEIEQLRDEIRRHDAARAALLAWHTTARAWLAELVESTDTVLTRCINPDNDYCGLASNAALSELLGLLERAEIVIQNCVRNLQAGGLFRSPKSVLEAIEG